METNGSTEAVGVPANTKPAPPLHTYRMPSQEAVPYLCHSQTVSQLAVLGLQLQLWSLFLLSSVAQSWGQLVLFYLGRFLQSPGNRSLMSPHHMAGSWAGLELCSTKQCLRPTGVGLGLIGAPSRSCWGFTAGGEVCAAGAWEMHSLTPCSVQLWGCFGQELCVCELSNG